MISMKLTEIAESLNGEFNGSDQIIKGVSIDTRSIKKDELFLLKYLMQNISGIWKISGVSVIEASDFSA